MKLANIQDGLETYLKLGYEKVMIKVEHEYAAEKLQHAFKTKLEFPFEGAVLEVS